MPEPVRARGRLAWGALGFAVGGAFVPGILSPASLPKWAVIAIAVPLLPSLDPRAMRLDVMACLCAAMLWAALLIPSTPYPPASLLEAYLLALLVLTAVAASAADLDQVDACIAGLGWGVALSSPLVILQRLGFEPITLAVGPAGLYLNSEVLALVAAPVIVWAAWGQRFALIIALLPCLALSGSRTGLLAAALGLLAGWRGSNRAKLAVLSVIVAAGIALLLGLGADKVATAMKRFDLWLAALHSITLWGGGLGWWGMAHPVLYGDIVHSDALQAMVELGVGAVGLLAVPMIIFRSRHAELGDTAARAAFAACCVEACISFPIHAPASGFVFFLLAGHLARARHRIRDL